MGTLVTVGGAMVMTLVKGALIDLPWTKGEGHGSHDQAVIASATDQQDPTKGLMMGSGCFCWAAFYILQSYPAALSLTALICMLGSMQWTMLTFILEKGNTSISALTHRSHMHAGFDARDYADLHSGKGKHIHLGLELGYQTPSYNLWWDSLLRRKLLHFRSTNDGERTCFCVCIQPFNHGYCCHLELFYFGRADLRGKVVIGCFLPGQELKPPIQAEPLAAALPRLNHGASAAGSPTSRGTLSESSGGGPGSPLNQSTGAYTNNNAQSMTAFSWK